MTRTPFISPQEALLHMKYSSPRVPLSRKWPPPPRGETRRRTGVWACLGLAHHACRRAGLFRACSALTSRPSVHRGQMSHEDLECRRPVGVGEAARTVVRIASWKPGLDSQLGLGQRQGDRGVACAAPMCSGCRQVSQDAQPGLSGTRVHPQHQAFPPHRATSPHLALGRRSVKAAERKV